MRKWYEQECQSNPEELKQKLNLHFGKRTEEFDFGRLEVKEELDVPELPLLQSFQARRRELEERREILALELQRKKLERKETLETSEKEELEIIKAKLENNDAGEISKKTIEEIKVELQQNRKAQLELYSGKDIDLIAKVYGVDLEGELRKRAEESISRKKAKDKKKGGEGKAISILMARTRESQDERVKGINNLNKKIAKNEITDEELEILEQAGIDVSEYRRTFRESSEIAQTGNSEAEREGQIKQIVRKGMKDTAKKEEIVAEKLFERVNDDEIKSKSKRILRESIVGELKQKAAVIKRQKGIEELTEEEMQEIDQEVQRIDVNGLIEGVVSGRVTEEQQDILDELKNGEYGFDIESHKSKIKDKSELERRIRKDKLEKLKAGVTMGIEVQKKIDRLKGRIDEEERQDENISKFIYGNSWYVALDEEGYVIDSELNSKFDENGIEEDIYQRTLEKHKKRQIQPEAIEEVIQNVTAHDKEKVSCELQEKDEEKTKEGDIIQ